MSWRDLEQARLIALQQNPNGVAFRLYPNGSVKSQQMFVDGVLHGRSRSWRPDGTLASETNYRFGVMDGDSFEYSLRGRLEQALRFRMGRLVSKEKYDDRGRRVSESRYG